MYYSAGQRDYLNIPAGAIAEGETRTVIQCHPPFLCKRTEDEYPDNYRPGLIKEYSVSSNYSFIKHVEIGCYYNGDISINASDIRVRFTDDKSNVCTAQYTLTAHELDSSIVYFTIDELTKCIVIFTTHLSWYVIDKPIRKGWDATEKKWIFEEPSPQMVDLVVDLQGKAFIEINSIDFNVSVIDIVGDVAFNKRSNIMPIKKLYKLPEIIRAATTFECQLFCNKEQWAKRCLDQVCSSHICTLCIYIIIVYAIAICIKSS